MGSGDLGVTPFEGHPSPLTPAPCAGAGGLGFSAPHAPEELLPDRGDRHTGLGLKRRCITWARLDHAGKDSAQGQRGSSAKGDDIDVIWELKRTPKGIALKRDAARMGWVPPTVEFMLVEDPVLRYEPLPAVTPDWPQRTREVASLLDTLGVPVSASKRIAQKALQDAGKGCRDEVIRAAQKLRLQKFRGEGARTPDPTSLETTGAASGADLTAAGDHQQDPPRDPPGLRSLGHVGSPRGPYTGPGEPSPVDQLTFEDIVCGLQATALAPVEESPPDPGTVSVERLDASDGRSAAVERPRYGRKLS